jgi:diguanylate cyclase (GGDEF)-like protein
MWYLIILILLTVFLNSWLRKILYKRFSLRSNIYENIKNEYDRLLAENAMLKTDKTDLHNKLEQNIALYDITKQICRTLDADRVFNYFCEEMGKYIEFSDCKFVKNEAGLSSYKDYTIVPLMIDKNTIGYLAVGGIKEHDKNRFHILAQQFVLGIKRAILYQRVQELAITDSLTQISSRRYYLERFYEEIERSKKFNYNFSCFMIDIDHFKGHNDRYGHLVGDVILKEVAKLIKDNIRQIDLFGRYGGEEFSIILTETDREQTLLAAERIRQAIESKYIKAYDEDLRVTVSIGISFFPENGKDIEMLIDKADSALYQAKQQGRNRVCVFQPKADKR